ncbi:MAG: hypothetical protein QXF17_01415 [Ignisphaera sp.]
MIRCSEKLTAHSASVCRDLTIKCLKANFALLERIRLFVRTNFYFILKSEGETKYGLTVNEQSLAYTYPLQSAKKFVVQIYVDDWYIPQLDKVIISSADYFTLNELARRISHELTHVYAFQHENRTLHKLIDDAIKEGTESSLPKCLINYKHFQLQAYDIKGIVAYLQNQQNK